MKARVLFWVSLIFVAAGCGRDEQPDDRVWAPIASNSVAEGELDTVIVFAHQDDELLWMLPFWSSARRFVLAAVPTSPAHRELVALHGAEYSQNWVPVWGEMSNLCFAEIYWSSGPRSAECTRISADTYLSNAPPDAAAAKEAIKQRVRKYVAEPEVKRIVTHNPWGEYGHIHHRLVSAAVRELGVELGKEVVVLGSVIGTNGPGTWTFADVDPVGCGVEAQYAPFDGTQFQHYRGLYLDVCIGGAPPDYRCPGGQSVWTGLGPQDYPTGTRPFLKVVTGGRDLATDPAQHPCFSGAYPLKRITAADWDGNGVAEILGSHAKGGALWRSSDFKNWAPVPGALQQMVVGDFNGDGRPDVAGLNDTSRSIYYTTDLGRSWTRVPGQLDRLVTGDFNGDGRSDLAGVNRLSRRAFVTTNLRSWLSISGSVDDVASGDFNRARPGDELAGLSSRALVYSPELINWKTIPGEADQVVAADINGDGQADLAVVNDLNDSLWLTTDLQRWTRLSGKVNRLVAADFNPNRPGQELAGIEVLTNNVLCALDFAVGSPDPFGPWRPCGGKAVQIVAGDFNPDRPGQELAGIDPGGIARKTRLLTPATWE
ncbi:MAG: VCBS repeat-containing protein [Deltaproteobacteria bacterium]|nr:VCBS repeat-containing protein [Deltaproteobacteria bacterium]